MAAHDLQLFFIFYQAAAALTALFSLFWNSKPTSTLSSEELTFSQKCLIAYSNKAVTSYISEHWWLAQYNHSLGLFMLLTRNKAT